MRDTLHRREFLEQSSCAVVGFGAAMLGAPRAAAAEPIEKPRPLFTVRDSHLRDSGAKNCWTAMDVLGADGVEAAITDDLALPGLLHPEKKYSLATVAGVEAVRADMKAAGKRITALCMYNRFEERPDVEVQAATKAASAAAAIGAKAIRIDVVPRKMQRAEFLDLSARTLRRVIDATEATAVAFGIENHGSTTNDPEFLQPLFERVGSRRLGLTLDTGNFYWFGHPLAKVYELFETFASRVFHTHCKSIRYPEDQREKRRPVGWEYGKYVCPVYEGDIDFRRVMKILSAAGYANDFCVEDESLGKSPAAERREILAKEIRHLKEAAEA